MRSGFSVTVKLFIPADIGAAESVAEASKLAQSLTSKDGLAKIGTGIEIVGQPTIKFVNQRE